MQATQPGTSTTSALPTGNILSKSHGEYDSYLRLKDISEKRELEEQNRHQLKALNIKLTQPQEHLYLHEDMDIKAIIQALENTQDTNKEKHKELSRELLSRFPPWHETNHSKIKIPQELLPLATDNILEKTKNLSTLARKFISKEPVTRQEAEKHDWQSVLLQTIKINQEQGERPGEFLPYIYIFNLTYSLASCTLKLIYGEICHNNLTEEAFYKTLNAGISPSLRYDEVKRQDSEREICFTQYKCLLQIIELVVAEARMPATLSELLRNFTVFKKKLGLYFSLSREGYQTLADYIQQQACDEVIEVMAGSGYTTKQLSTCGLSVKACDVASYPFTFAPVEQCDAMDFVANVGNAKDSLKHSTLLICSPPPTVITPVGGTTPLGSYLPLLYNRWIEHQGGPVIIFSECTVEDELHHPAGLGYLAIKLRPLPEFPRTVKDDAAQHSGFAKAFEIKRQPSNQE